MTAVGERLCEWDNEPHPTLNFWTIGNVSEVIPGIARPLMSTFFNEVDYRSTAEVAGYVESEAEIPALPPPVATFLGTFAGRFALNLAWANAIIATWQTEGASGLMDQFITSTDGHDIKAQQLDDQEKARRIWAKVQVTWAGLGDEVARDTRQAEAIRAAERERDWEAMSEADLWRHLLAMREANNSPFARHLFVSGAAGDHTDRLNKLLDRALPGHDPALVIALTSALRDVESAKPSLGAWDVAQAVKAQPGLADEVRGLGAHAIAARLAAPPTPAWRAFAERFAGFIAAYGYRGQREADPSAADWEEDPTFALSLVKTYLDAPAEKNPYTLEERTAQGREAIEAQLLPAIPDDLREQYETLLAGAQRFTRMREASKANWVRVARLLRRPLVELGRRFQRRGLLETDDDIFYLLAGEVERAARGDLDATEARAAVARRKTETRRLEALELPEVFQLPVTPTPRVEVERPADNILTGMPVSAGSARGPARVVLSVEAAEEAELHPGEILIAPYTDAPWTPLFVPAAAVVVETGGVLSHAATVAREFGIPAVVAVKGATRLIRTGQMISVDGMTGQVRIE